MCKSSCGERSGRGRTHVHRVRHSGVGILIQHAVYEVTRHLRHHARQRRRRRRCRRRSGRRNAQKLQQVDAEVLRASCRNRRAAQLKRHDEDVHDQKHRIQRRQNVRHVPVVHLPTHASHTLSLLCNVI